MKVLFTIISINKCETKRTLTLKVVDEDMYTFVTFLWTYYWKDHKHTDKNKMTVRDLKKWCWLSYCSPKHCFVRHSGKCSEYHRLDGAGALFSSFASFHYVEELVLKTNLIYAVFPWNSCRFFQRIFGFPCSCERSKKHEKALSAYLMAIPSSIILLSIPIPSPGTEQCAILTRLQILVSALGFGLVGTKKGRLSVFRPSSAAPLSPNDDWG